MIPNDRPENPVEAAAVEAYIAEVIRIRDERRQIRRHRNPITHRVTPIRAERLIELFRELDRAYEDLANNPAVTKKWKKKCKPIVRISKKSSPKRKRQS